MGAATATRGQIDAAHDEAGTGDALPGQQDLNGGEVREPEPPAAELALTGSAQLKMFDVGGKKATSSSLRLVGGKIELVDGTAFKKGTTVVLEVVAVINHVGQQDKHDAQTNQVTSCEQQHKARITDVRVKEAAGS